MSKRRVPLAGLILALALAALLTACGGEKTDAGAEQAAPPPQTEQAAPPAEPAGTVAAHDCAGGCGMTEVPEDQMTEIDGKWYCAGCAKAMHDHSDHSGHGHG